MSSGSARTFGSSPPSIEVGAERKHRRGEAAAVSARPSRGSRETDVKRRVSSRASSELDDAGSDPIEALRAFPHRLYTLEAGGETSAVIAQPRDPRKKSSRSEASTPIAPNEPLLSPLSDYKLGPALSTFASIELTSVSLWGRAPEAKLTALGDLVVGDRSATEGLWLWPLREEGRIAGGVVLKLAPRARSAGATARLLARLEEDGTLRRELAFRIARNELEELQAFRGAVGQALPFGFLGLDPLGRVLYLGGAAEEILGVSEGAARGRDCARIFRAVGLEDQNPLLDGLKGRSVPIELYIARPDGRELAISLQVSRVSIGGSGRRGLVAFFRDLSEERALAEAESQRDRLAALGELSAGVAHEIRNPLTGIANCAQVLKEGRLSPESHQKFLDIILDEAARLNRIVEGLLRYARPHRPELREADILECVRRSLDLEAASLAEKGVRTRLTARGRIPLIYIDAGQVEQVLLNLVRNAGEAMPQGGELKVEVSVIRRLLHRRRGTGRRATDRVRFAREAPRARFVQVKVSDTGNGIPKDLLPRIWNPFFTTRTRGTGLGLSLSLSIVREHGGTLTARSVEGKGTTLLMDLPIERRQGERRTG